MIVGGGLGLRFGEPWAERLADGDASPACSSPPARPTSASRELGDLGGAIGAALLVSA